MSAHSSSRIALFPFVTLPYYHLDQPLPIDLDGEFIGYAPATIDVFPHHIRVFGTLTDPRRQKITRFSIWVYTGFLYY